MQVSYSRLSCVGDTPLQKTICCSGQRIAVQQGFKRS
jgi:hypothetical protein